MTLELSGKSLALFELNADLDARQTARAPGKPQRAVSQPPGTYSSFGIKGSPWKVG